MTCISNCHCLLMNDVLNLQPSDFARCFEAIFFKNTEDQTLYQHEATDSSNNFQDFSSRLRIRTNGYSSFTPDTIVNSKRCIRFKILDQKLFSKFIECGTIPTVPTVTTKTTSDGSDGNKSDQNDNVINATVLIVLIIVCGLIIIIIVIGAFLYVKWKREAQMKQERWMEEMECNKEQMILLKILVVIQKKPMRQMVRNLINWTNYE